MKKILIILLFAEIFTSCDGLFNNQKIIVIKGQIASSSKSNVSRIKSSNSGLTLADATKVLVFYGQKYSLANITNGSFSSQAPMGSATCLVFLDANNKFIGNLFAGGLNLLPLVNLSNGENTQIDLSTLNLEGTNVIPANNPIGNQIQLSADEVSFYQQIGAYYEALAKNIDADNNGIPDILNNTEIRMNTVTSAVVGLWGINSTAPVVLDTTKFKFISQLRVEGAKKMLNSDMNVQFSGPTDSPYTDIVVNSFSFSQDDFMGSFYRQTTMPQSWNFSFATLPFKSGIYTLTFNKTDVYTLNYSSVNAQYYMVLPIPTLHTNNSGQLTSVTYEYKLPNGKTIDPKSIIGSAVMLQINDMTGKQLYESPYRLYGNNDLTNYNYNEEVFKTPINISNLQGINACYTDLLGNEYNISWRFDALITH